MHDVNPTRTYTESACLSVRVHGHGMRGCMRDAGVHVRPLNANDVLSCLELEIVTFTLRFSMLYELFLASLSSFFYPQFQACFNTNVCN